MGQHTFISFSLIFPLRVISRPENDRWSFILFYFFVADGRWKNFVCITCPHSCNARQLVATMFFVFLQRAGRCCPTVFPFTPFVLKNFPFFLLFLLKILFCEMIKCAIASQWLNLFCFSCFICRGPSPWCWKRSTTETLHDNQVK